MKFAIAVAVLLVGFSIFYYLVIFLPQQNQQKLNSESIKIIKEASNQAELESCLDEVNKKFSAMPTGAMKGLSYEAQKYTLNTILEVLKQKKEECYKKYPQK